MEWKKIIKYEEERHDALGGLTFSEYMARMNAESEKKEREMTPLVKLYRSMQSYIDTTIADEMSRVLNSHENIDNNASWEISSAISKVEEAIYEVEYVIQDLMEEEKNRLKEEQTQPNQGDKK